MHRAAIAVPWIFDNGPEIQSNHVRGIKDLWNGGAWNYSYNSLR